MKYIILLLFVGGSCLSFAQGDQDFYPQVIERFIPKDKFAFVEQAALSGDGAAALKLSVHYDIGPKEVYWTRIAAENGNVVGMYNYSLSLIEQGGKDNLIRAAFWLAQVVNSGCDLALDAEKLNRKVQHMIDSLENQRSGDHDPKDKP